MATRSAPAAAARAAAIVVVVVALVSGCAETARRREYGDSATCGPLAAEASPTPIASGAAQAKVEMGPGAISVDGSRPSYRAYVDALRERIRLKWRAPGSAGVEGIAGEVVLDLFIASDGHLEHVQLAESSGTQAVDDAAVLAVKSAQPFAPVPEDVCRQTLSLTMDFWYRLK